LTANLQLPLRCTPLVEPAGLPRSLASSSTIWSWWSLIELLHTVPRPRLSRPRAVRPARLLTSPVATTHPTRCRAHPDRGWDLARRVAGDHQASPPPPPRQRQQLHQSRDAFPRRVSSPPLLPPASAFASARKTREIIEDPPPCPRLCRRWPASSARSPARSTRDEPVPNVPARPGVSFRRCAVSDASRRLLQSDQPTSTTVGSTNPRSALPTQLARLAPNRRG